MFIVIGERAINPNHVTYIERLPTPPGGPNRLQVRFSSGQITHVELDDAELEELCERLCHGIMIEAAAPADPVGSGETPPVRFREFL